MTHPAQERRGTSARLELFALLLFAVAALTGCDQSAFFDSLLPKDEVQQAQDFVAKVAAHDNAAIEAALDPQVRTPDLPQRLDAMAKMVPAGVPKAVRTVGAYTKTMPEATTYDITLEYEYPGGWLLAAVGLERRDGKLLLRGINFVPRGQSLEAENRFTLEGKGPLHYAVLAYAVAVPLFVVYALVLCARTKFPRRKWLWLLFVAVGFVQVQFNWSTGDLQAQPISFMLLGAGFIKAGPVAPWILTVTLPVGAVVFLLRRRKLRREAVAAPA